MFFQRFTDCDAEHIGEVFKIARACPVSNLFRPDAREIAEARSQHAYNRRAGRRDQLFLNLTRIDGRVAQNLQRGRRRHGEGAVSTLHCATTHVERRTNNLVDCQGFCANGSTGDVHNGINRAYFMKMNMLNISVMDPGLRCAKDFKDPESALLGSSADVSPADNFANLLQATMSVMVLMRMLVLMGMLIVLMMRMAVLVVVRVSGFKSLLLPEFFAWKFFLAGGDYVQLDGADATALHARNFQPGVNSQGGNCFLE